LNGLVGGEKSFDGGEHGAPALLGLLFVHAPRGIATSVPGQVHETGWGRWRWPLIAIRWGWSRSANL